MKNVNTLAVTGVLSMAMAASLLAGCGSQEPADGTQTAMVIDGHEISLGLANYFLRTEQASTYAQMESMLAYFGGNGSDFWSTEEEEGVTYGESFKNSVVTDLTNLFEIQEHAEELGVSVSDEEQQQIEEAAAAFMEKNAEAMETLGVSIDNVIQALQLRTLETKIRPVVIEDVDREVSDEEAAQSSCTYIRLSIPDDETEAEEAKSQMEEILELVLNASDGEDIGEIAEEVNEDCYSAQYSFDQGAYDDESNVLDSAVKEVLQDLDENEVHDQVIEGESYYFIIRMDQLFDEEATESKKESIITERETEKYDSTIEEWTDGIEPETQKCWDDIVVDDSIIYTITTETESTETVTSES
ncbi:MAG: hypothetical protein Q4B03_01035 [Lachnospiraceae bacterium]|nr:hypothetical protein [Lachnospiraceae bacterium]